MSNVKNAVTHKVYISGKISGLKLEDARNKFKDTCDFLKTLDGQISLTRLPMFPVETVNPMEVATYRKGKTWKEYMLECIDALFDCDEIFMLDNWETSRGARIERLIAMEMKIPISYQ